MSELATAEFDAFLEEVKREEYHVIILDFTEPVSNESAYKMDLQENIARLGLADDIFHLKVPYEADSNLVQLYGVTSAPSIVAISVRDKLQH